MDDYERFYGRIGARKGPFAAREARSSTRDFWVRSGGAGAEWLVDRIEHEGHVEALDGVANILADIGPGSIAPIACKLRSGPPRNQAEALLKALGWLDVSTIGSIADREGLAEILRRYATDDDADIREAAWDAMRLVNRWGASA